MKYAHLLFVLLFGTVMGCQSNLTGLGPAHERGIQAEAASKTATPWATERLRFADEGEPRVGYLVRLSRESEVFEGTTNEFGIASIRIYLNDATLPNAHFFVEVVDPSGNAVKLFEGYEKFLAKKGEDRHRMLIAADVAVFVRTQIEGLSYKIEPGMGVTFSWEGSYEDQLKGNVLIGYEAYSGESYIRSTAVDFAKNTWTDTQAKDFGIYGYLFGGSKSVLVCVTPDPATSVSPFKDSSLGGIVASHMLKEFGEINFQKIEKISRIRFGAQDDLTEIGQYLKGLTHLALYKSYVDDFEALVNLPKLEVLEYREIWWDPKDWSALSRILTLKKLIISKDQQLPKDLYLPGVEIERQ